MKSFTQFLFEIDSSASTAGGGGAYKPFPDKAAKGSKINLGGKDYTYHGQQWKEDKTGKVVKKDVASSLNTPKSSLGMAVYKPAPLIKTPVAPTSASNIPVQHPIVSQGTAKPSSGANTKATDPNAGLAIYKTPEENILKTPEKATPTTPKKISPKVRPKASLGYELNRGLTAAITGNTSAYKPTSRYYYK